MSQKISNDIIRKCKICGDEFHPTARKQFCCNKIKTTRCLICGSEITYICTTNGKKETCGRKCASELSKIRKTEKMSKEIKKCKWCGNEFHPKTARDVYCYNTHYKNCEVCGTRFEIDVRSNKDTRTCSEKCKKILQTKDRDYDKEHQNQINTLMDKYGVDNPMKIPGVIDKLRSSNQTRYGKDWYTQTEDYKNKVNKTSRTKYGTDHFLQNESVKDKRITTCIQKYGVANVSQSDTIKNKIKNTWTENYNVANISQQHIKDLKSWNSFMNDPRNYIKQNFSDKPTIHEIADKLGVCITSIYTYIDLENNSDLIKRSYSTMEDEVVSFIQNIDSSIEIKRNDRTIISPYEVDIYIREYRLAIECNPTYTHNSTLNDPWGGDPKPYNYHQMKTNLCETKGIFLFHVFGYEWLHKQDIIKSMIRNIMNKNSNILYARNCSIKEVSYSESVKFLNTNHRQGNTVSKIRLGLYDDNDELVSLMTFGYTRKTISKDNNLDNNLDNESIWELLRFCSKLNTSIVGGASRLFKYFIKHYDPAQIISFSDRAHTKGNLYNVLGFNKIKLSEPGYVWVNIIDEIPYNRTNAQKHNIKKFLCDDSIDLSKTENEIMIEHRYVKVFDSGAVRWEYYK